MGQDALQQEAMMRLHASLQGEALVGELGPSSDGAVLSATAHGYAASPGEHSRELAR
jgi:hypothetical protein